MQETEVQAFQDTLKLNSTEMAYLRAQVRNVGAQVKREVSARVARRLRSEPCKL